MGDAMKPIRMVVIESTSRPGRLSLRAKIGDATATAIFVALTESGAKPGDVLELRQVPTSRRRKIQSAP